MHKITVAFGDGSGFIFTLKTGGMLWERQDIDSDGSVDQPGIVANDHRKALLLAALDIAKTATITVTTEES